MANPFAESKTFHKLGNITNTPVFKMMPTPKGIALVTTKGRKSGKPRARPMRAVRDGERVYAVSILGFRADWLRNVRADANVTVKLGRKTYHATARELVDPAERAQAAALYGPVAGWYDYVDYANFVWSIPTRAKLLRVHDEWFGKGIPVVFELGAEV
ncbi:MAG: nitroreductase family deazaflavin-dependent oxidoreductase [Chloroflexota bacterium]|nr:nitroreductase family deazaflavin-dependent oxidoreductase [Chloroflexota bacterium]